MLKISLLGTLVAISKCHLSFQYMSMMVNLEQTKQLFKREKSVINNNFSKRMLLNLRKKRSTKDNRNKIKEIQEE